MTVDLNLIVVVVQLVMSLGGVVGMIIVAHGNRKVLDERINGRLEQGDKDFGALKETVYDKHGKRIHDLELARENHGGRIKTLEERPVVAVPCVEHNRIERRLGLIQGALGVKEEE